MEEEIETPKDLLERLANSNESTGEDSEKMEKILRYMGFENARVTGGLAYLEGRGAPVSINKMAEIILEGLE
jgi:hypothetical protein